MNTTIRTMIMFAVGAACLGSMPSHAAVIYSQNFTTAPNAVEVASDGALGTDFDYEDILKTGINVGPALDVSGGKAALTGNSSIGADTQASLVIILNASGLAAGSYIWSFDILDYSAGGGSFATSYSLYRGNGAISLKLGAANADTTVYPIESPLGAPTFSQIGSDLAFTGNGSYSVAFTLTEAGVAGDYLALTWFFGETADQSGQSSVNFSIDNIVLAEAEEKELYAQDFSGSETIVSFAGTGIVGAGMNLEYGEVQVAGWDTPSVNGGGQLEVGGAFGESATRRGQSVSVFIDTSGSSSGHYIWSFDISSFVDVAGADNFASYSVFEGNNVNNDLDLRFRAQNDTMDLFPLVNSVTTATFTQIGTSTTLTGNGTINHAFTLTKAGSAGDYVALTWYQRALSTSPTDSFDLDNIVLDYVFVPTGTLISIR